MTFEELQKANQSIKTMAIERKDKYGNVTSKDYAEVNQRIKAFRMIFPEGFIRTQMLSNEGGVCVFRAEVGYYDSGIVSIILGTGTAYEKEGSSNINRTSYIENCETSAIGRALGMCGFGIDTSVASYEEVATAMMQQDEMDKPNVTKTEPERNQNVSKTEPERNQVVSMPEPKETKEEPKETKEEPKQPIKTPQETLLEMKKELLIKGGQAGVSTESMLKVAGIEDFSQLTPKIYARLMAGLMHKIGAKNGAEGSN